jgi:hypothetical protein
LIAATARAVRGKGRNHAEVGEPLQGE